MPLSVRDFWSTLVRLRLLDAATVETLARQCSATGMSDPVQVAKSLIAQKWLTKFQAQRVLADRGDELVQGDFLVLDRVQTAPLSRWYRARHFETAAERLIFPCGANDSKSPVDPAWLQPHRMVVADGLQAIQVFETSTGGMASAAAWRGIIATELPAGKSLADWLGEAGPVGLSAAIALGEVVGGALTAMHAAGLYHGGIRPGRIWIGDDSTVFLLRSGGGPPIFPGAEVQPAYDWFDDDGQAATFAAPEWIAGQSHADSRSDVYSLGALIHHVATGATMTAGQLPPDIQHAVSAGASGDPVLRVLAASLALDPGQRFQDVASFLYALGTARSITPPQPATAQPATAQPVTAQPATAQPVAQPEVKTVALKPDEPKRPEPKVAEPVQVASSPVAAVPPQPQPSLETPRRATPIADKTPVEKPLEKPVAEKSPAEKPLAKQTSAEKPAAAQTPSEKPSKEQTNSTAAVPAGEAGIAAAPATSKPAAGASQPRRRKRNRRNQRGPIIIGASAVAVLLVLVAIVMRSIGDNASPPPPRPTPRPIATVTPSSSQANGASSAASATVAVGGFELVEDVKALWVPPWPADSAAPPLELIAPGSQAIVSLRLRSLVSRGTDVDWLGWFGQDMEPALERLRQRTGLEPTEIDRLMIGLMAGVDGQPVSSLAVWLSSPTDLKTLRQRWGVTASKTPTGETIFAGDNADDDAYFVAGEQLADTTTVSSFAVGPLELIRSIAEGGGGAIPLPRPLQTAWGQTSESAEVVAMVVPNFLFADGRKVLQQFAPRSIEPLKNLLIPNVTAAVVTIDTRQNWYGEVRLLPGGGTTAAVLARQLQDRMMELPAAAESFLIDSEISPSWRAMAIRLPQFLRAIQDQSRYGVSATLATANFYLPAQAAPQVTLASLLALSTTGQAAPVAPSAPQPTAMSIEQMLDTNLSISFEQESLEFAVAMIGEEFSNGLPAGATRPKITILGGDLEKSGITQNQQVRDFKFSGVPLRQVLTRLVAGANPDKTVTSMTDEKQALVWVVDPASTDQAPSLLITTRAQAAVKGYRLPQEFVAP